MTRTWVALLLAAFTVSAARAELVNARSESRSAAQGVAAAIRQIADRPAAWITYRVPMAADRGRHLCDGWSGRTFLEPPRELVVLARIESGAVTHVRTSSPDCEVDAGGMPVVALTDVSAAESASWLGSVIASAAASGGRRDRVWQPAISALGLQDGPAAIAELIQLAQTTRDPDLRREAVNWLTRATDPKAREFVTNVLTSSNRR